MLMSGSWKREVQLMDDDFMEIGESDGTTLV